MPDPVRVRLSVPPTHQQQVSKRRGLMIAIRRAAVLASLTLLPPVAAAALPACAELGAGLVGHPQLSAASATLVPAAGNNRAYCQVNITVSTESGPEAGYLPGQSEK